MKSIKISHSECRLSQKSSERKIDCRTTVCLFKVFKVCVSCGVHIERGLQDFGRLLQDSPN